MFREPARLNKPLSPESTESLECGQWLTFSLGTNGQAMNNQSANEEVLHLSASDYPIRIYTLGQFNIFKCNDEDESGSVLNRKGQHKPIEMLKALIALGGRDVGETRLSEALWPDTDGDVAHSAFSVTLHRLRKMMGHNALQLNDSRLSLNPDICWVDVWACEHLLNQTQRVLMKNSFESDDARQLMEAALYLYNGPFLGSEDEQPWFLMFRDRVHHKIIRSLISLCRHMEHHQQCLEALDYYHKGIELEPMAEEFYFRLMKCYANHGRKSEAVSVYLRCARVLESTLGVGASAKTRELYQSLLN